MGVTSALRSEIRRRFIPFAQNKGFELDQSDAPLMLRFRRITSDEAHIFEIQWEKYGRPRFVINFGRCSKGGVTIRGQHFSVQQVSASWLVGGRLQPGRSRTTAGWFRQDKPLFSRLFSSEKVYSPSHVVAQLIDLYSELDEYWEHGTVGPHLQIDAYRNATVTRVGADSGS